MTGQVWDMRVVWIEKHQRWWWNAWRESTLTELYGFADSRATAQHDMHAAVEVTTRRAIDQGSHRRRPPGAA